MHREVRGSFYLCFLSIAGLLLCGSGCSFVKMPQGWVLSTGWSLEFHRMPFNVSCDRPCAAACEPGCTPSCAPNCDTECGNPPKASDQPTLAPEKVEPAPTLRKVEEGEVPEKGESAGLMNLMKRRGRLGICATCGKMGRFQEPPKPAETSTMPVIAKFHPVPAAPVFCQHPVTTTPASLQMPTDQNKAGVNKRAPLPSKSGKKNPFSPEPEVIPPPPPSSQINRSDLAPRELDVPPEPPDWVFMGQENGTEVQSQKATGTTTRR